MNKATTVLLLAVALISGCVQSDDVTKGSGESLGPNVWSVNDIKIGDSFQKVTEVLGPGEKRRSDLTQPYEVYAFNGGKVGSRRPQNMVKFDTDKKVAAISGTRLERDGQTVLSNQSNEEGVMATLGIGHVKKTFTTKHGFIAVGSIPKTATYIYKDAQGNQVIVNVDYNYNTFSDTISSSSSMIMRIPPENMTERYAYGYLYWQ